MPIAKLYSMRKTGYVLRSISVFGALGSSLNVLEPDQGLSLRGTAADKLTSGEVLRKLLAPAPSPWARGTRRAADVTGPPNGAG